MFAISAPAPVLSSAEARDSVPPKRKMVLRSMDFRASFSEMTPVRIRASAPIQPVMQSLMPICFSKIMPNRVSTRITRESTCFHLGTLLKSCSPLKESSSETGWLGSSFMPRVA